MLGCFIRFGRQDGTCDVCLHTRLSDSLNIHLRSVHIRKADRSSGNHLQKRKVASCFDFIVRESGLNRKNSVKKPLLKRQITANSAKKYHRTMVVTVDESGHEQFTAHVLYFVKFACRLFRTDVAYLIAVNGKKSV